MARLPQLPRVGIGGIGGLPQGAIPRGLGQGFPGGLNRVGGDLGSVQRQLEILRNAGVKVNLDDSSKQYNIETPGVAPSLGRGGYSAKDRATMQLLDSPAVRQAMEDVRQTAEQLGYRRHKSLLTRVGETLQVTEAAGAGFLRGTHAYARTHGGDGPGDILRSIIHPAHFYHEMGAGFSEVPDAVHDHYTYADLLKDTQDPKSIYYRYAHPIGLGMSFAYDPTMYLSFGATSVSKAAAVHALERSNEEVALKATKMIAKGGTVDTVHGTIPADWNHLDEVMNHIKISEGRPHTVGDALVALREQGLARKAGIRAGTVEAGPGERLMARIAPYNVKGGRGVRFAGMEVPGTAALGEKLGLQTRGLLDKWAGRHVIEDSVRADALVHMARYTTKIASMKQTIGRDVRQLQRVRIQDPASLAEANIAGASGHVLVRPEQRVNLLDRDVSELDEAQRNLKHNINHEVEFHLTKAKEAGMTKSQVGDLRDLWDKARDYYRADPLMALAEWKFKATGRRLARDFTEQTLKDARFALPMPTKAEIRKGLKLHMSDKPFEAPAGFSEFTWNSKRFAVRNSVADAIREINNPAVIDSTLKRGVRMLTAPQNWWKIYATSPNPAFHVMNFLGAAWNNALAGVYNPMDYVNAASMIYKGRREEAALAHQPFGLRRTVPQSTPEGRKAIGQLSEAESRSGLGRSSFLFGDVTHGQFSPEQIAGGRQFIGELDPMAARQMEAELGRDRSKLARAVVAPPGATRGQKAKFYGVTMPRRAAGVALAAHLNPFAVMAFAPEIARRGQRVAGTIEDVVRLAPFEKFAHDPAVQALIHQYGPISVKGMRHPGFTKKEQATMYDIGAHISRHFQFDYTNLSQFERYFAKTVFPFWTFYKKNFVLQAAQLAKQPRKYATALRLENYVSEQGQDLGPWKEILPQYFDNIGAFQIPVPNSVRSRLGLPKGMPMFLNPKMPFLSLNMVPPLWDIINDPQQPSGQKFLEAIAPIMGSVGTFAPMPFPGTKLMLEAGTGHNLGLNRPIDYQRVSSNDYRNSYQPAPSWMNYLPDALKKGLFHAVYSKKRKIWMMTATRKYVMDQMSTPFINNLGQAVPVAGGTDTDRQKARANMISWLTGVRLMPVDMLRLNRNEAYSLKNLLESKQSEARSLGRDLSPDQQDMLSMVRDDLEIINEAYDAREGIQPSG